MNFDPIREDKCWGQATHIFASKHSAVSCLEVEAGFRCSIHRHGGRANMFAVLSGCIVVEDWPDGRSKPSRLRTVVPGTTLSIPSGTWHRFRVYQSGRVVEVYWPDRGGFVRLDDIEREDVGGEDDLEELVRLIKERGTWH